MTLEPEILQAIKKKKYEDVEAAWSSRIESAPRPIDWFLDVAREMRAAKAHGRIPDLLINLAETLAAGEFWEESLDAIREGFVLAPRHKEFRSKALEILRARYEGREGLEESIAFFDLENAEDGQRAFESLRDWLRFYEGEGFYLFGRGIGKVASVNLALQKIQVNFEKTAPLMVRRDEAQKLLTWIPKDHFLMRRIEDPETVHAEAIADPGSFLRELFKTFRRPLSSSEIRECMTGVVEGNRWNTWWSKAKSHPQVLPDKAKKNTFFWTASSETAQQTLLSDFETGTLAERLERARPYMKREGTVREGVLKSLAEELVAIAADRSPEALETYLFLDEFDALPDPAPLSIDEVLTEPTVADTVSGIRERRYREKLYRRLRKAQTDSWPQVYRDLFFQESDFRLMSMLYEALRDHGPERAAEKLVADAASSPRKTPRGFVWVTKNVVAREELRHRATHSVLSKIIDALDSDEFRDLKAHLREHFEPGGIAFLVFEASDRDAVDHLLNLVDSAAALEDHRKTEIRRAIFRKYPDIRKRTDDDVLFVTADSAEAKREEFEHLVKIEIPENAEAIRIAREYGDLRENFEYHAARQKHELLNSRAAQLHTDLQKMRIIDPATVDVDRVGIGTAFELEPVAGGPPRPVTILGHWDSDPDRGVYSYQSDFAKRLLGKGLGDIVEIDAGSYRVAGLRPWREANAEISHAVGVERDVSGD